MVLGLALLAVAASITFDIERDSVLLVREFRAPELCLIKKVTGMSCPSCGMTRSFLAMADGNYRAAVDFNSVGPLLFLVVVFQVPFRTLRLIWPGFARRTDNWDGKAHLVVILGLVALLLVAWAWHAIRFGLD